MEKSIFFCLLICMSIAQLRGSSKASSVLHIRKKRVIDQSPNGSKPSTLRQVPYIVSIMRNRISICGGSILAPAFIVTAAHCVFAANCTYTVLSNSPTSGRGIEHTVIRKLVFPYYVHRYWGQNDLALLNISPAINFHTSQNERIPLYRGHLPPNSHGIISGWGCHYIKGERMGFPSQLRSITVPILSAKSCRDVIGHEREIMDKYICTYYRNRDKCIGDGDSGGPLALNGQLLGVVAWSKSYAKPDSPDVFTNLLHPEFRNWIISEVPYVEL